MHELDAGKGHLVVWSTCRSGWLGAQQREEHTTSPHSSHLSGLQALLEMNQQVLRQPKNGSNEYYWNSRKKKMSYSEIKMSIEIFAKGQVHCAVIGIQAATQSSPPQYQEVFNILQL